MARQVLGNGEMKNISSYELKKSDIFNFKAGDLITTDNEIIIGLATIDESTITCKSAPVIRESEGDKSIVTAAAKVWSDKIKLIVTNEPDKNFLFIMITLA